MKKYERKIPKNKEEAKRIYKDPKITREAAGIAYLAALMAIDGYLLSMGVPPDKLPTSIQEYMNAVKKIPRNGKLMANLITAYQNLHIFAYYRGGVGVQMTVTQK